MNTKNGLTFNVVDSKTGYGIDGATFELRQNNHLIRSATSKLGGTVKFKMVFPGYYSLIQTSSKEGYKKSERIYNLYITNNLVTLDNNVVNFVIKNEKI